MKKKSIRRIATLFTVAVIGAGAVCMFAGCSSDHPEVTITYSFNGEDYDVTYSLSRKSTPETTQHFIELADSGFYDGTVVHNYDANFIYAGGYTINEQGALEEKDYFTFVKEYEKDHDPFTQTVFKSDKTTPLYTVVGEFANNHRTTETRNEYLHTEGALVMYYPTIDGFRYDVIVERADGGKGNQGEKYDTREYRYNSATCQFYTFLGDNRADLNQMYAVFGMAKDFDGDMGPLLSAIQEYTDGLSEEETFTTAAEDFPERLYLFSLVQGKDTDFEDLRVSDKTADFNAPLKMPITIKSVKVKKY